MSMAKANEKSWARPYQALKAMSPEQRDLIRDTLNFAWAKETLAAVGDERTAKEAWEIIDCDVRGIAGRLHTVFEQINPVKYITWRKALMRVLDSLDASYPADASEDDLEKMFVRSFERDGRYASREQTSIPGAHLARVDPKLKVAATVGAMIADTWDDVLGSEDWPAATAMYSICKTIKTLPTIE